MELYYEEKKEEEKKSKAPIILGIAIILCVILAAILIYFIVYLQITMLKVRIDGVSTNKFGKLVDFQTTQSGTTMYFPIRKIASYLGYKDYAGDFKNKSEDNSKCYVDNGEEIAMFTLNSNSLIISRGDSDYEEFILDEKVFEKNGELYTTEQGIEKAFNIDFSYQSEKNTIYIYTMDYMLAVYAKNYNIDIDIKKVAFVDKKAVLDGMMIVNDKKEKKYGVIDVKTGEYVLEPKYDEVSYLSYTNNFLVGNNKKYGIVSKNSRVQVQLAYDSITILDNKRGLYLVKEDDLYGVIDSQNNIILATNYQQIGVDNSVFERNALDNQYILLDKLIPVKRNNLWAFYGVDGKQVTDFTFTGIGCSTARVTNSYPLVVIPSLGMIVVEKDKFYNLIDVQGQYKISTFALDSAYIIHDGATGKNTYYMTYNGNTNNIEERFKAQGY